MLNVTIKMILKISGEKRYNFPKGLRLEKTIQFFNLLLLSKAKIGGESKSKSRYHIDCKKKTIQWKNHFQSQRNLTFQSLSDQG